MKTENREVLFIYMGGLGDVCLSESLFLSLSRHFKDTLVACGIRRFLSLFTEYFVRIENIESAKWLFLFSQNPSNITWERIIFTGKDREGSLRARLKRFSKNPMIFIDMYPEEETDIKPVHVEDYQLEQLVIYNIKPHRKEITPLGGDRIIVYPERGFKKEKWKYDNFVELYRILVDRGISSILLEPFDMDTTVEGSIKIKDLKDVKEFFSNGGVFVSNDSGMAHLAGACGLSTVTIFTDFDPYIWHPRGRNISLKYRAGELSIGAVLDAIYNIISPTKF
ncbi:MAG: hypothetical protein N3D15_00150 [Syntrophorhabdaceae bacterium]|nr:hypothetical protein [Syntrophorhabdaceae bacterium]